MFRDYQQITKNTDIVITKPDEESGVVIIEQMRLHQEAEKQLSRSDET